MNNQRLKTFIVSAAERLGFDLCGIAPAKLDPANRDRYITWIEKDFQGEMEYMKRFQRRDPALVLPTVRSVICVGMVYHVDLPRSIDCPDPERGGISRYAWGTDYHDVVRERLELLLTELRQQVPEPFDAKVYVDTGPLLERALAWSAGLGWMAKNTCLIHEGVDSWFFLAEILTSLDLEPDAPAVDRCGSCTRCLDACPTDAIVAPYQLDATKCISYFNIELKGAIPDQYRDRIGNHVFGCDICQDVCPWNNKPLMTQLEPFQPRTIFPANSGDHESSGKSTIEEIDGTTAFNPPLEKLAAMTEAGFREAFRASPMKRAKYRGFLRNVAVAMGNSGNRDFLPILEQLAQHEDPLIQ